MKTFYKIPSQWGSTFAQIYLSSSQSLLSSVHLSIDVIFRDTSSRIISISVLQATKVLTSVKEPGLSPLQIMKHHGTLLPAGMTPQVRESWMTCSQSPEALEVSRTPLVVACPDAECQHCHQHHVLLYSIPSVYVISFHWMEVSITDLTCLSLIMMNTIMAKM